MPSFMIHQFQYHNKFKDLGTGMCTFHLKLLPWDDLGKKWTTVELKFGEELKIWCCCVDEEEQVWCGRNWEFFRWDLQIRWGNRLGFETWDLSWDLSWFLRDYGWFAVEEMKLIWELWMGVVSSSVYFVRDMKRRRFDEPGTVRLEPNRGVPPGIWPEFAERPGIKTGTKTTPFCAGFMHGTACSDRNGTTFTTLIHTH